ncbi:LacI family transcriptional regulator [Acidipropionibacterium acidipropionici]|nr:LacI family transcriptional regulator [Acidipropionibacterium acidipropionici]
MAQVTLSDVARTAGVSLATASRVLNGSSRVPGKAISQRVMQAAEKLGYVPNASAQALARSSSGLLGVVIQDLEDPYFSAVAAGFQEAAGGQGQLVLMAQTSRDADLTIVALGGLNAQRVDGVLMVGSLDLSAEQRAVFGDQLARVEARGGQVVTVGQSYGIGRTVYPADREGGRAIGQAAIAGDIGASHFSTTSPGPPQPSTGRRDSPRRSRNPGDGSSMTSRLLSPLQEAAWRETRWCATSRSIPAVRCASSR